VRILVLRLSALGDVLLTLPALAALRRTFPDARIELGTGAAYAPLFAEQATLDAVLGVSRGESTWSWGRRLRERRYDLIIDLQHKVRTQALSLLGRPRRRLSLVKRRGRDLWRSLAGRPLRLSTHTADLYVRVLAPLGVAPLSPAERRLELRLCGDAADRAAAALGAAGLGARPFVALAPGAAHATKRWEAARFGALGAEVRALGLEPLAVGGPMDAAAVAGSGLPALPLDVDLATLAAVLGRARALVAGDTGPLHLAAAVGTPVVALYGPTDPVRWGPLGVPHRVVSLSLPCAPCSDHGGPRCPLGTHACMRDLAVGRVAEALRELLAA
jgi:ADP-heptose:LPS heptosyltransferase